MQRVGLSDCYGSDVGGQKEFCLGVITFLLDNNIVDFLGIDESINNEVINLYGQIHYKMSVNSIFADYMQFV